MYIELVKSEKNKNLETYFSAKRKRIPFISFAKNGLLNR